MDNIRFTKREDLKDLIELRAVRQTYKKSDGTETVVIDGLNYLVQDKPHQGQFDVILGKSGCGKSTILRYIAGLQQPSDGTVFLNGQLRKKEDVVGMVFQQYSQFEWMTVLENVMLPLEIHGVPRKERVERALKMIQEVGLAGHEHKFAKPPLLSGGQLQRVAIARSLVANPNIVLMDEPFGALDSVTRRQMQAMLAGLWESRESTVIFVTHDEREAVFLADNIYIMAPNPGRIVRHIPVDLPFHRDHSTKRTARFLDLVAEVEDALETSISNGSS